MPSCSVKWCGKNTKTSSYSKDGISFHKFPKIPDIKEKWIEATQRENWHPQPYNVICSRHFTPDCFENDSKKIRRHLFSSAVPTLFLPVLGTRNDIKNMNENNSAVPGTSHRKANSRATVKKECYDDNGNGPTHQKVLPKTEKSAMHKENDDEELDSTHENEKNPIVLTDFDQEELSPRERRMKRLIDHLLRSLSKKKKDVKLLQDRNRTQKKRIAQLKDVLSNLKQKMK